MSSRKVYGGTRRKLVLAFDVGTTYSGISYSVLDPGQVPTVRGLTKFPAQETISGASKIPTIIYYDAEGNVRAVGAEATLEGICEAAEDGQWLKAEWFKLHLRSKLGDGKTMHHSVPPLPRGKSVVDVFSDFLHYLLECAGIYIQDTHPNGIALWNDLKNDTHFVLSHPNGWEGKEQSQMRKAAVQAGLIPDSEEGHARLSFVTEGEASLHYAIENGVLAEMDGKGIVIVDAGGGTIDISTYQSNQPQGSSTSASKIFEEIDIPQCHFHGSVFVTFRAKDFLKDYLSNSPFLDDLNHITTCFDKTTKGRFKKIDEPQYVKFGSTRDNDVSVGIRFGQLKLAGDDIAKFFKPSIDAIIQCVIGQKDKNASIAHVVLVGGFAASDFLFNEIRTQLSGHDVKTVRPDNHVNKAVSDGAVSFYLDRHVRSRMARFTYGTECCTPYKAKIKGHWERSHLAIRSPDNVLRLPNSFGILLHKGTIISETQEYRLPLWNFQCHLGHAQRIETVIHRYTGDRSKPEWMDIEPETYTRLFELTATLPHSAFQREFKQTSGEYFSAKYEVILLFGLSEIKAQIAWYNNGVEHRSPAKLVYDNDDSG